MEEILKKIDAYFKKGMFEEAIELSEKTIQTHKDDYRLYSCLCRSYNNLGPKFFINYDSASIDTILLFTNYTIKALNYGEPGLVILLKDKNKIDNDLFLTSYMLEDLGDALTSYVNLIYRLKKEGREKKYIINLSESLFNELSNYYQQGFERFDDSFQNFRNAYNCYKEIANI